MGWYDRYVLPRVLDAACGMKIVGEQRAKIVGLARGVVLEPGIGGGLNLPFYQPSAVSKLIGVDPSVELGMRAKERSASVPFPVELWSQSAEVDVVAPESVDTVVFTYTLCTVPAPERVLAAAHRALKPDGMLVFCEHSCAPDESVRRWQKRIEPVWKALAGGCHLTRNAVRQLEDAGFLIDTLEQHYVEQAPRFAGFHQIGRASKAGFARGERAKAIVSQGEGGGSGSGRRLSGARSDPSLRSALITSTPVRPGIMKSVMTAF
jgi:ubiquinone/menaquinone biosynthesis C-methylase UbiE